MQAKPDLEEGGDAKLEGGPWWQCLAYRRPLELMFRLYEEYGGDVSLVRG